MPAHLAQVCLFKANGDVLRRFCDIVSGDVEHDDGNLLSYHMGGATVAHHPPMGMLGENDVMVTVQVESKDRVDKLYHQLVRAGLHVDDEPEDTEWGWRVFYFKVSPHLYFEVGAAG